MAGAGAVAWIPGYPGGVSGGGGRPRPIEPKWLFLLIVMLCGLFGADGFRRGLTMLI